MSRRAVGVRDTFQNKIKIRRKPVALARLGELTFLADQAYISNYQSTYENAVNSNVDIILLPM